MTSGYKLIDLRDISIPITGDAVNIPGTYDAIEYNYRKAIMITNLVVDGVECSNRWVNFRFLNNAFVAEIGFNDAYLHLMLKIDEDDNVSIFEE